MTADTKRRKYSHTRDLCDRYDIVPRTVARWVDAGILPKPVKINKRLYFDNDALEQKERERMRR
jgi:predicted site-specific integrase-resolvase